MIADAPCSASSPRVQAPVAGWLADPVAMLEVPTSILDCAVVPTWADGGTEGCTKCEMQNAIAGTGLLV